MPQNEELHEFILLELSNEEGKDKATVVARMGHEF
jgi:hypothetical protein